MHVSVSLLFLLTKSFVYHVKQNITATITRNGTQCNGLSLTTSTCTYFSKYYSLYQFGFLNENFRDGKVGGNLRTFEMQISAYDPNHYYVGTDLVS